MGQNDHIILTPKKVERQHPSHVRFPIGDSVFKGSFEIAVTEPVEFDGTSMWFMICHGGRTIELGKEVHNAQNPVHGSPITWPHTLRPGETLSEGFCLIRIDVRAGLRQLGFDSIEEAVQSSDVQFVARFAAHPVGGTLLPHVDVPVSVDLPVAVEKTYEMLWDCQYCGSMKLLGKTHRHCPACGSAQDSDARYFPADEDKVAVEDHQFVGVDWECSACDTPNSAAAEFCMNCGCGKDGSQLVDLAHETEPASPAAPAARSKKTGGVLAAILGLMAMGGLGLLAVLLCVAWFWRTDQGVTVSHHSWERTIEIEVFQAVDKEEWKDALPSEAYDVRCTDRERSTEKVPDGQDCKMVQTDNGDGTFREKEECKTKYREVSIMEPHCDFTINAWERKRVEKASAQDLSPQWPPVDANTCVIKRVGCEREGEKGEHYRVHFLDDENREHQCDLSQSQWEQVHPGTQFTMSFGMMGGIDCSTLPK